MLVQSKRLRSLVRNFVLSCGLSSYFSLSSVNTLRIRGCSGVRFSDLPGFSDVGKQILLFCCSNLFLLFIYIGSQVRITLWNHTEDCHIFRFNVVGLLRSDYGEFCNMCILFYQIWWFRCFGYPDCFCFVGFCQYWMVNQQTCCFRKFLQ